MDIVEQIYGKLSRKGAENIVVQRICSSTRQVRFSENSEDLFNEWKEDTTSVFASIGRKVGSIVIKNYNKIEESVDDLIRMCRLVPDNPSYNGINPEAQDYSGIAGYKHRESDLQDLSAAMISSAVNNGVKRTAGLMYDRSFSVELRTNYNESSYTGGGGELVIRSFTDSSTGQESLHFGHGRVMDSRAVEKAGEESARMAMQGKDPKAGEGGRFTVLMGPYLIGNILTYSSGFLSSYSIDAGLSCFIDQLGKQVGSDSFTLVDDPTDYSGIGARPFDDEGTVTRRNTIIENGVLKKYMHSYSTGRKFSEETTGNAGIISPRAWQLRVKEGRETFESMLSGIRDGLFINNTWYTRFQDYRNGVFSTVPRDGVFRVKNGEITESWNGIRISDSVLNILKNIKAVSRETKNAKWWEEIEPSIMPYVTVENVNVSRSF